MNYALKGEVYSGTNLAVILLMGMVKAQIDDNNARYQEICEKRKKAIESRWKKVFDENNSIQENTNVSTSIQVHTDNDSDSDCDSEGVYDNESGRNIKRKRFIKPTKEEIENYCKQKGYHIDAQQFIDYYESVGWVIGKSGKKMKSWQSALSTWESRRSDKPKTPTIFENQESDWVRQRREQEERERREFNQRMFEENKKRINAKK